MVSTEGIGWAINGEGCITLTVYKATPNQCKIGYVITPRVSIVNSDPKFLQPIQTWLKEHEIKSHLKTTKFTIKELRIQGIIQVSKLLDHVQPYLVGKKKECAKIVREFIDHCAPWLGCGLSRPGKQLPKRITKKEFLKRMEYVDNMEPLLAQKKKRKYSKAYFERIL